MICGDPHNYCYYVPTDKYEGEIRLVKKVKVGFRFEEFYYGKKSLIEICYFQFNEKQLEWDGKPVKYNRFSFPSFSPLHIQDLMKDVDEEYQKYIRPLERRKKLEKLNSI